MAEGSGATYRRGVRTEVVLIQQVAGGRGSLDPTLSRSVGPVGGSDMAFQANDCVRQRRALSALSASAPGQDFPSAPLAP
eukprot:10587442-Alexandrium_andersonii.AAC.1